MSTLIEKKTKQTVCRDGNMLQFIIGEKTKTFYNYKQ